MSELLNSPFLDAFFAFRSTHRASYQALTYEAMSHEKISVFMRLVDAGKDLLVVCL